ncbi:MAG: signal peptidase I [Rickettsiales bacterium]|nr:signal peptidase I [Rickettsiales bacterium]
MMKIKKIPKKLFKKLLSVGIVRRLASALIRFYMKIVFLTSKVEFCGAREEFEKYLGTKKSIVITSWHGRVFILPAVFRAFFKKINFAGGAYILSSKHRDGLLAAEVLAKFGFGQIFGSSINRKRKDCLEKSGAVGSILEMMRKMTDGSVIFLAPDGPLGPPYQMNSKIVDIAKRREVPIFGLAVSYSQKKQFKSWDEFQLPFPFGKITVEFLKPVCPLKNGNSDEYNALLGERMNKIFENDRLKKPKIRERGEENGQLLSDFLWALCFYLITSTFFFQNFFVPSGSMKPGLLDGDYIIVSKLKYGYSRYSLPFGLPLIRGRIFDFSKPKRGDVIVFALPRAPRIKYIKRLVGLPGDKIQIKNKILYVNGEEIRRERNGTFIDDAVSPLEDPELLQYLENIGDKSINILQKKGSADYYGVNNTKIFEVPAGHYFFMGDNRENSRDSRFDDVGVVSYENIVGQAKIIFFSKSDSLLKFWKLGKSVRFGRIFQKII